MEFCSGKTLTEFIESNKTHCTNEVLVDYTFQLASGLHYLHENMEFIHGCLAPTSILMEDTTGEKLKIANLNGAFQRKSARSLEEQIKSFDYLTFNLEKSSFVSPEMILGLGHVGEGFPLLPQIPEDMPDELKFLAGYCLKVNPDDRPTAAILVINADPEFLMLKALGSQETTNLGFVVSPLATLTVLWHIGLLDLLMQWTHFIWIVVTPSRSMSETKRVDFFLKK
ncbi:hypothetical protein BV898_17629 [Hypsibius exemplaris]|uniref:Protein kinase domain-containing protein n=1 Tax=Hypsibius exemplaris TaxID=2072580 RepID=A0A9X6RMM2_HYPEX|nr:hypothetical protein BV898_17629 [Hypsibius exemplaris]